MTTDYNESQLLDESCAWLRKLIAYPTVSSETNLPLIEDAKTFLESIGGVVSLHANPAEDKANLFATWPATKGGETEGGILFSGHSDVVPVEGQPWSTDPFDAVTKDGKIYGRGSSDMKGFSACFFAMAPYLRDLPRTRPIHFMLSYDEEIGCLGAPVAIEEFGKTLPRPSLVVVGEPTRMQPISGHKSIASYETTVRGHEIHSSRLPSGVSAVEIGARIASWLFDQNAAAVRDDRFDPPHSTIHVGIIEGGTAGNIVARDCRLQWEIRAIPAQDRDSIVASLRDFCAGLEKKMQAIEPETFIKTEQKSAVVGFHPTLDSEVETLVRQITGNNSVQVESYCSEAGQFQHAGLPTILLGPGDIAQAHKPDEWIEISQLAECNKFLHQIVRTYCC